MLNNYNSGISLRERADVQNRAKKVGGICGTITAIEILNYFNIKLTDEEIKKGILDSNKGTNQVNMALYMSKYLDVSYCVNYDIKTEIENGPSPTLTEEEYLEFIKLIRNKNISFKITPSLESIINTLNNEKELAQFVFIEPEAEMSHFGLLCNVKNNLLEFTQRENGTGIPDVTVENFENWWDSDSHLNKNPKRLVLIYRQRNNQE